MYAIAVRDNDDLFLVARVHRNTRGGVFVAVPRPGRLGWDPHSSYHPDGRYYVKTYDRPHHIQLLQKPDANFRGTHNMSTLPIASFEPREINVRGKAEAFAEVFEVHVSELRPEEYSTYLSVDLTEPDRQPSIYRGVGSGGAKILRQASFQEAIPWIWVTLSDTHPNER